MSQTTADKPNVLFVITDDQGYGDLGCHGNTIINTPHLDKLHSQSISFTNFHVGPTCAPTRAGIMTGRYCNSTGCLLYTSPSPRDRTRSRMPSSA